MTPSAEHAPLVRAAILATACGLAFGSLVAVGVSALVDRLRR